MNNTTLNRGDGGIKNVLRMLRPILEEKGIIGTVIKATELAKICRAHHRRLPVRGYRALELAEEINAIPNRAGGLFEFDDLTIEVYDEIDFETRRRSPSIEFQLNDNPDCQCSNSLQAKASQDETTSSTSEGQDTI